MVLRYNLTLVDISNYVPGDTDQCNPTPSAGVCEYHLPPSTYELLSNVLGDQFVGMDNGEQDGRYIGRYAAQASVPGTSRREGMLAFLRHFKRMTDDLGPKMMSLNSLYFPHYFARSGLYTGLAAETAQEHHYSPTLTPTRTLTVTSLH